MDGRPNRRNLRFRISPAYWVLVKTDFHLTHFKFHSLRKLEMAFKYTSVVLLLLMTSLSADRRHVKKENSTPRKAGKCQFLIKVCFIVYVKANLGSFSVIVNLFFLNMM